MTGKRTVTATWLALFCAIAFAIPSWGQTDEPPTVVIVIRHAEKATGQGDNPSLSPTGVRRAHALVAALGGADVKAIYSTQFNRTRETVDPLAKDLDLRVTELMINESNAGTYHTALASEIRAKHRGETVVVVGHSNTVPLIVQALSGKLVEPIEESEYDRIYMVVLSGSGEGRVISVRYGP